MSLTIPKLESYTVADVSTGELTVGDLEKLENQSKAFVLGGDGPERCRLPVVYEYDYGYFVYCWHEPDDTEELERDKKDLADTGYSAKFVAFYEAASKQGHKFINFDCDGPEVLENNDRAAT